ncbi:MFS transporter [Burkholderia cenocepacia]|uniref:MFS transporter n=1 Tax=Burkholderia cenocepacia TaxID=95486 RepID=UPI00075BF27D|nr:MFS transporter [Burkholderia cenocepacia]AOK37824.1 MFS transporter [Burkholderia cenocepacia]KWF69813.1 MFS transporter [Burkholderia cenocepacia]
MDVRVYLLAAAVFLAGVAENICVGILPAISAGLHVSIAAAGQLTTIFSVVFALAALVAASFVARVERRTALLAALGAFAAANLGAAASPGYASLFAARVLMAASCATLILVATRFAAELAPASQRGRAIGIVFMGISASLVLGVPIGMRITEWAGWRAVFVSIAMPALPLGIWLARRLPRMAPAAARASGVPSYRAVLARPRLLAAQCVSIAMIGGHFTLFAYLTPYLQAVLSPGAAALEGLYVAFGMAGVTGAWLGGLFSDRLGASRALCACPAVFLVAMAVLPAAGASPLAFVPAMMLWGGISWSISPIVQNYLIHTAPSLADASVGINVSAMHAGVALGSAFGGVLVGRNALLVTPWAGCVLVAVALACAWVAARPARQVVRAS